MRKGVQIFEVRIENGQVIAKDANGDKIKLSRTQRNVLANYNQINYIENIQRAFNSDKILSKTFTVYDNGEMVKVFE